MAVSFDLRTEKSISFSEFLNFVEKTLVPEDTDTLLECIEVLQMLSNNDEFLLDLLHEELRDIYEFQKANLHSAQSLTLHQANKFYIRANAWPAMSEQEAKKQWQDDLYLYLMAHDHNFSFLTVGYFGDGYATEIWEYNPDTVVGYVGEKVDMQFLEKTTLPKGKAMFYRASQDIHAQLPSKDYSISLNIMPLSKRVVKREQFWFDLKTKTIASIAANSGTGRYLVLDLAKLFGNNITISLLEELSSKHELPYVRMKCYDALANLSNQGNQVWEKAVKDNHLIVKEHAKLALEGKLIL